MRLFRPLLLAFLLIPASLSAQQSTSTSAASDPQAVALLQKSLAAANGGALVTDVTMTGTVTITSIVRQGPRANASSTTFTDSGTVMFVATAAGQGLATVTTPAGTRTEIRDISSGYPTLTETGFDGKTYTVTTRSAASPHPGWFFPAFVMNSGLSSSAYASSYIGQEAQNGASVQHVAVWLLPAQGTSGSPQFPQSATQHDIYLDPVSLLPLSMRFTIHPYDLSNPNRDYTPYRGKTADMVQEVAFSDYRLVGGRHVAFHIHTKIETEFVTILSDTQFTSVTFNTGATIPQPTATAN